MRILPGRSVAVSVCSLAVAGLLLGGCSSDSITSSLCGVQATPVCMMSDLALFNAIAAKDGRVSIGFKEADAPLGIDESGRPKASAETKEAMQRYLLRRGMTFSYISPRHGVAGRMPLSRALLSELRRHPNIDYVEPEASGIPLSGTVD